MTQSNVPSIKAKAGVRSIFVVNKVYEKTKTAILLVPNSTQFKADCCNWADEPAMMAGDERSGHHKCA